MAVFLKMASFECEFVEKPPKSVQSECPICLLVLREPYQATCCGKSFCKDCIHRIKAANQACPTCNDQKFNLFHNKGLQQSLYDFQVYCTHKSKGCEWTGELRELDNHLNSDPPADKSLEGCPFTLINCPLSCAGCEKGMYRKDVKSHVNDRLLGLVMMQRDQLKSFEQQLQEYCTINTQLKEDKEYLEQRVIKLETKAGEFGVKIKEVDNEVAELKLKQPEVVLKGPSNQPISKQLPVTHVTGIFKLAGAEFTMTDFEEYKRDNDSWYSPSFYTHPNGYKMCLSVYANGNTDAKGTHLTVYVLLMRGDFDDQLKWPFCGEIAIRLVNQEEDKDHVVNIARFARSMSKQNYCKRVMTEERSPWGWRYGKFFPHAELQPKYLKNDCIKLCIKRVEIF